MDIFAKCDQYTLSREVRAAGVYPYYRAISSAQDPIVVMDGEEVVMLGSMSNGSVGGLSINMPGPGNLGFYLFLNQACVSVAGLILYMASDLLAVKIVEE